MHTYFCKFGNFPLRFLMLKKTLLQIFARIRTGHNIEAGYLNSYSKDSAEAETYI